MRAAARSAAAAAILVAALASARPATTAAAPRTLPRGVSYVAYARARRLSVYARPGARGPRLSLPNPYRGGRLTFLVRALRPQWARVYLPTRPNGSGGWVRRRQVELLLDYYRLRVDLGRRRLIVWRRGRVVMRQAIGVGRSATPTPTGRYYVVELIQLTDPHGMYGPYAFGISAHSNVYTHFGSGDGEIGIHGTDYPQGVGSRVSHGCIRLHNAAVVRLAKTVPLGTPVDIVGKPPVPAHGSTRPLPPRGRPHVVAPPPPAAAPTLPARRTPRAPAAMVAQATTRDFAAAEAAIARILLL